jgi:DNA polymerase-3 subunit alpha
VADSFVHLHVHTEYSMLDGAARVTDVVAKAAQDGQPAVGITDHGNMYGVLDFYSACRKVGVTPVVGSELYMAHDSRFERPARRGRIDDTGGDAEGGKKLYYHLTALAENEVGYKNLIQLASRAYLEGYYYKPRVDWDILAEHSEGLIVTTGCLGGHVLQSLLADDFEGAVTKAARLQDIFGRDNLFVEIQDHGIPEQHRTNPQLFRLAKHINAPLLATNDSHYTDRADCEAHDALLCVQTGAVMSDPDRFKFSGDQHYLKTAAEMRDLFRDVPEACDNTLWIAERAKLDIAFGKPQLPRFPIPEGFTDDADYLQHLTMEGARARWGANLPDTAVDRLAYELKVIGDMGFSSYFLIVWDLIRYARDAGVRVGPGRGSAAGCAVAYCLRITELDPIRYDLLFERFLNPSRISMPDIDMDFDSRFRDEMIRYAAERYGRDHVAQIVTFSQIKARAAVRDAARVLGYPYAVGDKIAKAMPPLVMGRDTPLYACLDPVPKFEDGYKMATELRSMYELDPDVRKVVDVARGLEGLRRQDGIHAAAVVITRDPLTDYLPIQRKPEAGQPPENAPVVTQYEMHGVEDLGLLKMDFLGLRNLDVISDTLAVMKRSRGIELDIDNVPLDDPASYELLSRGDTVGVFQLESPPMRALLRAMAPSSFEDVSAVIALYRPGPMSVNMHYDYADRKNGRKPVEYFHPDAEDVLHDTYGLMIYQESVMRVAQKFAGYSLAEADNLRKACGKKIRELMAKERQKFEEGVEATGYGKTLGKELFDVIERFADYAFNKSHSFGYGYITYQTAYLKANYPVEYLSSLLTSVKTNLDKAGVYLNECRQLGITVLTPDVNRSESDFVPTPDGKGIYFGLSAVRNVGEGLVELLIKSRDDSGAFNNFYDFCGRVDEKVLNKRTVESLIKAGAFDSMGHPRQGLLTVYEQIIDSALARRREHAMGIQTLFGAQGDGAGPSFTENVAIPDIDFAKRQKLAFEKEMLGLYVSDHPLMGAEKFLARKVDCSLGDLGEKEDGNRAVVGGVVTGLVRKWTKKGDLMAVFTLEDLSDSVECMVFPKTMQLWGHLLTEETNDQVVLIEGRIDKRDDLPKVVVSSVELADLTAVARTPPLRLRVPVSRCDQLLINDLRDKLSAHPGDAEVFLHLEGGAEERIVQLADAFSVDTSNGLVGELRELLGAESVLL